MERDRNRRRSWRSSLAATAMKVSGRDIVAVADLIPDVPSFTWLDRRLLRPRSEGALQTYAKRALSEAIDFASLGWGSSASNLPATDARSSWR